VIARTWHGMTPAAKADAYLAFLKQPEDRDFLLEFEPRVEHSEVFS
jgi:hypothetical protein